MWIVRVLVLFVFIMGIHKWGPLRNKTKAWIASLIKLRTWLATHFCLFKLLLSTRISSIQKLVPLREVSSRYVLNITWSSAWPPRITRLETQLEQECYTFLIIAFYLIYKLLCSFLVWQTFNLVSQVHHLVTLSQTFLNNWCNNYNSFSNIEEEPVCEIDVQKFQVANQSSPDLTYETFTKFDRFSVNNFIGSAELWENEGFIHDDSSDTVHHNIWRKSKLLSTFPVPGTSTPWYGLGISKLRTNPYFWHSSLTSSTMSEGAKIKHTSFTWMMLNAFIKLCNFSNMLTFYFIYNLCGLSNHFSSVKAETSKYGNSHMTCKFPLTL